MFLAGADGQTPELRAPSIKGAMRFWWRALNGHLVEKNEKGNWDYTKLKKKEEEIFGGTGDNTGRSTFSLQVIPSNREILKNEPLVPHDTQKGRQSAFSTHQSFKVTIRATINVDLVQALFELVTSLGGIGKRSRRGMGAYIIEDIIRNGKENPFVRPQQLSNILGLIQTVVKDGKFAIQNNIIQNLSKDIPDYPFLKSIEIGHSDSRILEKISKTTHNLKNSNFQAYEVSLGHASKGRFASPIYVSVLEGNMPIITTLNTVPKEDKHKINRNLQDSFKQKIL